MIRGHASLSPSGPKTNADADVAEVEQPVDGLAQGLEQIPAGRGLQHDQREQHLQAQAPGDGAPIDGVAGRRGAIGDGEDDQQPDQRLRLGHLGGVGDRPPPPPPPPAHRRPRSDRLGSRACGARAAPGAVVMRARVCRARDGRATADPPARVCALHATRAWPHTGTPASAPRHSASNLVSYRRPTLARSRSPSAPSASSTATSAPVPLYAMRECFFGSHSVPPDPRERPRRPLADHLLAAAGRVAQVRRHRDARRQPGRGRHPGADGAAASARDGRRHGLRCWCCWASSARRCSTATA